MQFCLSAKCKIPNMKSNTVFILAVFLLILHQRSSAQEYSNNSLKFGVGLGMNEGLHETGMGGLVSFGLQKSVWKDRVRINPNIIVGNLTPFAITDKRDQFYRITNLGINGYLDVLKYKWVSLFIGVGTSINYSRGLLGTGGWPEAGNTGSDYLFKLYFAGNFGGGIRINPPNSKVAFEIAPFNFYFGNDHFMLGFLRFGVDLKLNK